jgi:hypothetical protein
MGYEFSVTPLHRVGLRDIRERRRAIEPALVKEIIAPDGTSGINTGAASCAASRLGVGRQAGTCPRRGDEGRAQAQLDNYLLAGKTERLEDSAVYYVRGATIRIVGIFPPTRRST